MASRRLGAAFYEPLGLDVVPSRYFRNTARDRLRGVDVLEPGALLPWGERFDAVVGGEVNLDAVWPDDPHWLPPGWEDVAEPIERLRLICKNPILSTLALSINTVYPLLPDPDAVAYLNTHTMLGATVAGCRTDSEIAAGSLQMSSVFPSPGTLVDDSRLPDISSILAILNMFSKFSLIKNNQVPFLVILKKGLPLSGSDKQIEEMVCRECENEMFYRTFNYMIFCCVMGTYDWIGECPYDYITQSWITHFFLFQTRGDMVALYADPANRNLLLYACTAFLIHSIDLVPTFRDLVYANYDWDNIVQTTREAIVAMRQALVDARYTDTLTGPGPKIFHIISEVLPKHSKTLKDDFKTKKNGVSSIYPNVQNAARAFLLEGVARGEKGPFPMDGIVDVRKDIFLNTVALSEEVGVGINAASFAALPLTARGRVTALDILKTLEIGDLSKIDMYMRLGPGDFSVFMAFVLAQRELLRFEHHTLSDRVHARQEQAIRENHQLVSWQPLPRESTHLPFCPSCKSFKVFAAGDDHTGMNDVCFMPFTGAMYCFEKENPECCHLVEIPMLGRALTVDRATYIICCYCAQLCSYGNPDMIDSYPWCGHCVRS